MSVLITALFLSVWLNVYPFLALTHRVEARVLVVEGWVHDYTIQAAVTEFRDGSYDSVLVTGGPVEGTGRYVSDYQTSASVGAAKLQKSGLPSRYLNEVPSHVSERERTYGAAIALRNWLEKRPVSLKSINVMTEDVHARRTRYLYQEALGPSIAVGVIAVPNPDYDAHYWWRYSEGVKTVFAEALGYLFAKVFIWEKELTDRPDHRS